jgi:hypothetical protein
VFSFSPQSARATAQAGKHVDYAIALMIAPATPRKNGAIVALTSFTRIPVPHSVMLQPSVSLSRRVEGIAQRYRAVVAIALKWRAVPVAIVRLLLPVAARFVPAAALLCRSPDTETGYVDLTHLLAAEQFGACA